MAKEYGFVYILGNDSMPGIYKIGFTMGHPKTRMEQLSSATACPTPFEMVASFGCENPRDVESFFHKELDQYRINSSREFFKVSAMVLRGLVDDWSDEHFDFLNDHLLNVYCANEQRIKVSDDKLWKIKHYLSQEAEPFELPPKRFAFD